MKSIRISDGLVVDFPLMVKTGGGQYANYWGEVAVGKNDMDAVREMSEQTCGSCRFWSYTRDVTNQWTKETHQIGECGAPQPDSGDHNPLSDMASTEGKTCPCYQRIIAE